MVDTIFGRDCAVKRRHSVAQGPRLTGRNSKTPARTETVVGGEKNRAANTCSQFF